MKGTPETPQCGFSRTSIQILGMQGVDPAKFTAFNVLEDEELRRGMWINHERQNTASLDTNSALVADHRGQESRSTPIGPRYHSYTSTKSS
jgi:hypothetical protein